MQKQEDIKQKKFYSEIKYPGPNSTLTYLWASRISKYYNKDKAFTLLDAGCGSGNDICAFLDYYKNCNAIGVDQSLPSLEILKERCQNMGFNNRFKSINQSYLEEFKLNNKADISIAIGTIGHSSNADLALKNIIKNTKEGGMIGLMLYSTFGTYEKNKLIEAINILKPKNDEEFMDYVYDFEKQYPHLLYKPLNTIIINLKNYISHYLRRIFKNKTYGYLESLPADTVYKDAYITKIEKSFTLDEVIELTKNNKLEILEFYSLGDINIKKIPKKWKRQWEKLSFIDKARISSLINFKPTSWSILTKRIN